MRWTPGLLKLLFRIYGPYFGAGIKVNYISKDWHEIRVSMKLHWYNKNAVGSQFGGSLYSMVDPHLMLMLMKLLGEKYVVWDKSAEIEFIKPGLGTVTSKITVSESDLQLIKEKTFDGAKYLPEFNLEILSDNGELVAKVKKTLYIKRKSVTDANNMSTKV